MVQKSTTRRRRVAGDPSREIWLRALSTATDPSHRAPSLVLYRLLKLTNLITRPFLSDDALRYHLSINELRILMSLAPLREAASHELGMVSGIHPMNVSRAVAALRRRGRVSQRTDPDNRRRKLLQLTADGWKLYREMMPHVQQVATTVFGDMSAQELALLSRLIDRMTTRLETINLPNDEAARDSE